MRLKAPGIELEIQPGELYFALVFVWSYFLLVQYFEVLLARAQCAYSLSLQTDP
jgi:hypothetical protein